MYFIVSMCNGFFIQNYQKEKKNEKKKKKKKWVKHLEKQGIKKQNQVKKEIQTKTSKLKKRFSYQSFIKVKSICELGFWKI